MADYCDILRSPAPGDPLSFSFEPYVGSAWADSSLAFWYFYPTESGWTDYPYYMCALRDVDGAPLVGGAYQSGW